MGDAAARSLDRDDDTSTTFAASNYFVDDRREPGRVVLRKDSVWPSTAERTANALEINYVAGYGDDLDDVPEEIRLAIMMLISHWYENREPVLAGVSVAEVPHTIETAIFPYRMLTLG